jgi:hypothetical protein
MIDRQHGKIIIECDSCDETFEGEPQQEFTDVWSKAKRDGWNTRQIAGEWLHGCSKCGKPS